MSPNGKRKGEDSDNIEAFGLERILAGLNVLAERLLRARLRQCDAHEYGLTLAQLAALGIARNECRDLIARGLLEASAPLTSSSRICLTSNALAVMQTLITAGAIRPSYEIAARELTVAREPVFQLAVQARNLTAVLASMEYAGWLPRVEKPLAGSRGGNDPHHLANAASTLNSLQHLIRFRADDGAICWKWR